MMTEPTPPTNNDSPPDAPPDAPSDISPLEETPGVADALPVTLSGSGVSSAAGSPKRSARTSLDPFGLRALIISWCLWLLVSWSITLAIGATVHAVRWVVFSAVFGLMAVWPALRLSQQLPGRHACSLPNAIGGVDYVVASPCARVLATMLDWVCLLLVFQVVVWPLMLVGRWSAEQTLWLDLAVVFWSLLTAVLVGLGRVLPFTRGAGARVGAMLLCMLLLIGEPVGMAIIGVGFDNAGDLAVGGMGHAIWQMRISPLQALWELTTTVQHYDPSAWRPIILSTAAAAGLGLLVLVGMALLGGRGSPTEPGPGSA